MKISNIKYQISNIKIIFGNWKLSRRSGIPSLTGEIGNSIDWRPIYG